MSLRQVAVVTGASSGIGRAIALAYGQAGYRVVVNYARSQDEAETVVEGIRRHGHQATAVQADVSDAAAVKALVAETMKRFGRVDVWVNNAGADILTGAARDRSDLEKLQMLLNVDVTGTFLCCQAIAPILRSQGSGVILNMSWDHVVQGMAGREAELYGAAKGAIWSYSKSLARSLAPAVRVNILAPGWVKTKFGEQLPQGSADRIARSTPMQRWGVPKDLTGVALFLASPAAEFITGQTFAVNGGVVMH